MSFDLITSFEDLESYLVDQTVKSLPAMRETRVQSLGWEDPLEKEWQPTPIFLLENAMVKGACWATVQGVAKCRI